MKGHKAFKRREHLVICLFVLIAAFGTKGWMETTMDNQQANDTIFEEMDTQQADDAIFTEEWWQTIETPQTYIYTAEDGTLYEVTVNPDGSSTERCIAPDGSITVETWDAPIVSGTIIKQTGVIIDSNGNIVTYEFTKDSADGSYNYSWNSNIPNDEPSSYFFAVNGDGSVDVIISWNDGSIYLKHVDAPSPSGSIAGYVVFMPAESATLSITFLREPDGSFSGEINGRVEGVKEEFVYQSDESGSLTAKDVNRNVIGTMIWDSYGVTTYADGIYTGKSQPSSPQPDDN
jgi:hypothetical protein